MDVPDNIIKGSFRKGESGLHPTQKPIDLMKCLIELATKENQLVLDPFCGSGTTLLAAQELNRNFIGIEKNLEYYTIANNRLLKMKEKSNLKLF